MSRPQRSVERGHVRCGTAKLHLVANTADEEHAVEELDMVDGFGADEACNLGDELACDPGPHASSASHVARWPVAGTRRAGPIPRLAFERIILR